MAPTIPPLPPVRKREAACLSHHDEKKWWFERDLNPRPKCVIKWSFSYNNIIMLLLCQGIEADLRRCQSGDLHHKEQYPNNHRQPETKHTLCQNCRSPIMH